MLAQLIVEHWLLASISALLLVASAIIVFLCDFRRPGEPPLVGGYVPVMGAAFEIARNGIPDTITKCSQTLGDVFTITILRKRLTFVTNAQIIPTLSKLEARGTLSNFPTRFEIIPMVFGDGVARREVVKRFWSSTDPTGPGLAWSLFHGRNLEPLTMSFQNELVDRIETAIPEGVWKEGKLLNLIAELFLPATTRIFFGKNPFFQSREYIDVLMKFNDYMNALYKGQQPNSIPEFVEAKRKLIKAILTETDDVPFEAVQALMDGMDLAEFNENEKAFTLLSVLWASNMNAIVSAFWALFYILHDPVATAAIQKEVRDVMTRDGFLSADGLPTFTMEQLKSMKVTDSACMESMRISSANILRTEAMESFVMETPRGNFKIRKGDNVVISTGHIHMDPELYPEPEKYKFDRFAPDPVTGAPKTFMKDGQKCHAGVMVFSHGKHMCPGRYLAMNELKLLLLYVFTRIDISFIDHNPELDKSFYGVGALKPKEDLRIRYRLRSPEA